MADSRSDHGYARLAGACIRRLRQERGWSQAMLAERARCTQQEVSKVEGGKVDTPIETLGHFAEALGVPLARLFEPFSGVLVTLPAFYDLLLAAAEMFFI